MEEANKENAAGRSTLQGALNLMKRRPLQAIASQGEDDSAPLIHRPLTYQFSKPIEVFPKPEQCSSKETEEGTEEKSERERGNIQQPPCAASLVPATEAHHVADELPKSINVPPSSPSLKTHAIKIKGYSHAMKISKHDNFSTKKEPAETTPHWILYFHPYLEDSIQARVQLEITAPAPEPKGSRGMRMVLVDWLAMLQVFLRQDDTVLHLAVRLLDMVLAKEEVACDAVQLTALAAFWIASKSEMQFSVSAWSLCRLCKNSFTVKDLNSKEKELMKIVECKVPIDTPISICSYIITKLGLSDNEELHHVTTYLLDVSLLSWDISWLPHSQLASAATCCALQLLSLFKETAWETLSLFDHACHSQASIRDVIAAQLQLLSCVQGNDPKFTGIKDKYSRNRYLKVSKMIQEADIKAVTLYFKLWN